MIYRLKLEETKKGIETTYFVVEADSLEDAVKSVLDKGENCDEISREFCGSVLPVDGYPTSILTLTEEEDRETHHVLWDNQRCEISERCRDEFNPKWYEED